VDVAVGRLAYGSAACFPNGGLVSKVSTGFTLWRHGAIQTDRSQFSGVTITKALSDGSHDRCLWATSSHARTFSRLLASVLLVSVLYFFLLLYRHFLLLNRCCLHSSDDATLLS